jgi:hypothetical protein
MAITEIQSVSGTALDTHPTVTLSSAPATGNLLVAIVNVEINGSAATITMPAGWTFVQTQTRGNAVVQGVYYKTAAAGESQTVTATISNARLWVMFVVEAHSTITSGWQLDKSAGNLGNSNNPTTGTTATTGTAEEYLVAGICVWPIVLLTSPTNSFAIKEQLSTGAANLTAVMLTRIASATGAYTTGGTYTGLPAFAATIQTFRPATATVTAAGAALSGAGSLEARGTYATPTLFVGAAFGYFARDQYPVWTNISTYVRSITWTRGKQNELNQLQAGTASVVLNDPRSYFDPNNTASPFYPNVTPGMPVRALLFVGTTMYTLFHGFAERLPRTQRVTSVYTERQFDLIDGFALLAYAGLGGTSYPQQTSDQRVAAVLDNIGWPGNKRVIGTGSETLAALAFPIEDTTTAQAHIQQVVDSEDGLLYVDGANNVVFVGRAALASPPYTVSSATFKDTA